MATSDKSFNGELLESIFKTSKKTIQEYVREIERNNRYRSCRQDTGSGYILDDRARLIDLYEACLQQDAHIRSVVETLESQILGDRYMLARVNEKGKYIKDVANSLKRMFLGRNTADFQHHVPYLRLQPQRQERQPSRTAHRTVEGCHRLYSRK